MTMNFLLMPLVGALIGYLTNWIAIKMLFRPAHPVYIGSLHVPLTPGLIPKEKLRLAQAIGDVVGTTLLSEAQLRKALLSQEMKDRLSGMLDAWLTDCEADERTVRDAFLKGVSPNALETVRTQAASFLAERIRQADLGGAAAQSAKQSIKDKTAGGIGEKLGTLVDDRIKQGLAGSLQCAVNGYIDRHADELMAQAVEKETDALLSKRVCDLRAQYSDDLPVLREKLFSLYEHVVRDMLSGVLRTLDLSQIVRDKIESIPNDDLEGMILGVVDRELKAIVWLGAVLGLVMGCVNWIFL